MEKVIKFLVKDQTEAYKVIEKLRDLNFKNEISLAETYVLEKSANGSVSLKDERGQDFELTAFGALSGGLVGLLGGPAGFLLGTAFGTLFGSLGDLLNYDSQEDILYAFGREMPNGASMVISHVYEDWTTPIDTALGEVSDIERINVDEEINKSIQEDLDQLDKDIEEAKQSFKDANEERKAKLQAKIDELKEKRKIRKEQHHANALTRKKAFKMWFETFKKKAGKS